MNEDLKLSSKEQWRTLKRLLKYLTPLKTILIFAVIFLFIAIGSDLLRTALLKQIVDEYITISNPDFNAILGVIGSYLALSVFVSVFRYMYSYRFFMIGNKVTQTIRLELFEKLQSMGMRYFDQTPAGSLVSRVTNDTDSIQEMLVSVISVAFSSSVMVTAIIAAMFYFHPKLAMISIAFIPIVFLTIFTYQRKSTRSYQKARSKLSELNTKLAESIAGMSIIQMFNQQKRLSNEFAQTNQEYYQARLSNLKLDGLLLYPIIHLLTSLTLATILIVLGVESFTATVSAGLILIYVDFVYMMYEPLFQIMDRLSIFQQAVVSASRVFSILDHQELTPAQHVGAKEVIKEGKIEFRNVTFSYDGKHPVLKNISFTVNAGETIALVGQTGSGKSSIINVMMRFYEFFEGDVLIDDISIRDYPLEELRRKMSLVLQDPFIYYGNVIDNIRLLNDEITEEEVVEAARFVQADSFIEGLPDTYHHHVAERGAGFSSGQKQLIAFARTIVTNPKILILDEATANIDTETESLIQEALNRIRQGRTSIAIAHRLSTIKDANQILVLSHGEIIERGSHQELLDEKGTYYQMYQLQSLNDE